MEEQKPRLALLEYTNSEMNLIRNTFYNKDLLLAFRKFMWQLPLNAVELSLLEVARKKEVVDLLYKAFLPTLESLNSLEELRDMWIVDFESVSPEHSILVLRARKTMIDYFEQQLSALNGGKEKTRLKKLSDITKKTPEDAHTDMAARNMILKYSQYQLNRLLTLSAPEETPEERKERLQKDSSK